jgi:hypothetical protein
MFSTKASRRLYFNLETPTVTHQTQRVLLTDTDVVQKVIDSAAGAEFMNFVPAVFARLAARRQSIPTNHGAMVTLKGLCATRGCLTAC